MRRRINGWRCRLRGEHRDRLVDMVTFRWVGNTWNGVPMRDFVIRTLYLECMDCGTAKRLGDVAEEGSNRHHAC